MKWLLKTWKIKIDKYESADFNIDVWKLAIVWNGGVLARTDRVDDTNTNLIVWCKLFSSLFSLFNVGN